jgi:hypothetical protein
MKGFRNADDHLNGALGTARIWHGSMSKCGEWLDREDAHRVKAACLPVVIAGERRQVPRRIGPGLLYLVAPAVPPAFS